MTLATEITASSDFDDTNSEVTNAVTEATNYCTAQNVTDDEIIKAAAMWILINNRKDRKGETMENIDKLIRLIERMKKHGVTTSTRIVSSYKSPKTKGLSPYS